MVLCKRENQERKKKESPEFKSTSHGKRMHAKHANNLDRPSSSEKGESGNVCMNRAQHNNNTKKCSDKFVLNSAKKKKRKAS